MPAAVGGKGYVSSPPAHGRAPRIHQEEATRIPRQKRIVVQRGLGEQDWYWPLRAGNGRITADSAEGHRSSANALGTPFAVKLLVTGCGIVVRG